MNKARVAVSVFLFVIPLALAGTIQAASMDECRTISDRLARYACYDGLDTGAPVRTTASSTATATSSTSSSSTDSFGREPAEPVASEDDDRGLLGGIPVIGRFFGGNDDDQQPAQEQRQATATTTAVASSGSAVETFGRPQDNSRVIEGADGRNELRADIADLEQIGPSLWLVTLENGQKWRQMESKAYRLQKGDSVRIYPTRWGVAYRLSVERLGSYIQVRRVD